MDISISEFNELTEKRSLLMLRIAELERSAQEKDMLLKRKDEQILQLTEENAKLTSQSNSLNIQNQYLRNMLYLSVERVKEFMQHVKGMMNYSFLRTFLEWTTPEKYRNEQLALLNEVMALPDEKSQMVLENPTFQGPMYDVHDNDEVKLDS
ncbi:MAG: hypothetical protein E7101_06790 [Prevotella ruminicola]|jgi:hypothetical protein|uniref:Uncharacterized protein n=1 Tax=Xylanibacter ruminicola TaxID=839 RepID=A0A9D5P282_XYLRU|nr:hypothetical protein [Xylanibacter ruminicola]